MSGRRKLWVGARVLALTCGALGIVMRLFDAPWESVGPTLQLSVSMFLVTNGWDEPVR